MKVVRSLALLGAMVCAVASGCVTVREEPAWATTPRSPNAAATAATTPLPAATQPNNPAPVPRSTTVRTVLLPLGTIPYDEFSLPIVSPDGRFMATQTGAPPTWAMVLAQPDATAPEVTRVEIWQTDLRADLPAGQQRQPTLAAIVDQPVLLGRSCDENGFLIESPQPDGSRWIGEVTWSTGEITWLIQDEFVNAFASLGPGGRLAWSRRAVDGDNFELVIRADRIEWSLGQPGEDWLMPVWGGPRDGLFVLQLSDPQPELGARLHALHMRTTSKQAIHQSLQRLFLAEGATIDTVMQCLAGQVNMLGLPAPALDQFVFLHPTQLRMAIWRPQAATSAPGQGGQATPLLLIRRSIAAVVDQPSVALVSTDRALFRQQLTDSMDATELLKGTVIARPVGGEMFQYLLLSVSDRNPGQIGLTGLRLEPM